VFEKRAQGSAPPATIYNLLKLFPGLDADGLRGPARHASAGIKHP